MRIERPSTRDIGVSKLNTEHQHHIVADARPAVLHRIQLHHRTTTVIHLSSSRVTTAECPCTTRATLCSSARRQASEQPSAQTTRRCRRRRSRGNRGVSLARYQEAIVWVVIQMFVQTVGFCNNDPAHRPNVSAIGGRETKERDDDAGESMWPSYAKSPGNVTAHCFGFSVLSQSGARHIVARGPQSKSLVASRSRSIWGRNFIYRLSCTLILILPSKDIFVWTYNTATVSPTFIGQPRSTVLVVASNTRAASRVRVCEIEDKSTTGRNARNLA